MAALANAYSSLNPTLSTYCFLLGVQIQDAGITTTTTLKMYSSPC